MIAPIRVLPPIPARRSSTARGEPLKTPTERPESHWHHSRIIVSKYKLTFRPFTRMKEPTMPAKPPALSPSVTFRNLLLALVLPLLLALPTRAAGLLVADGGLGGQLEITQHDVHVTINNGIAV